MATNKFRYRKNKKNIEFMLQEIIQTAEEKKIVKIVWLENKKALGYNRL